VNPAGHQVTRTLADKMRTAQKYSNATDGGRPPL